ncbi:hypothetical protein FACS189468_1680 [Spirochaetia bacterium]|nr:hypothetical protein FACS189468_1680 [Spirochaetia bacterium]
MLVFEWDKNTVNIRKHGVSFEDAKAVFFDPLSVELYDKEHNDTEERWKLYGLAGWVLIVVNFTEQDGIIRIISARRATIVEEEVYYHGYGTKNCK